MVFPVVIRSSLPWLESPAGILATLGSDPTVELCAWEPAGSASMQRLHQALVEASEPERGEMAIAAMDRYLRLNIDGTGRAVIPSTLLSHLEVGEAAALRIVMRNGRLWLWSERYWQSQRSERIKLLDDAGLP
ncbi:hypothetical protein NKH98_11890 [Mesorhizobium sp. M0833]|uniref:hypothetical protein n=1 Tax=Mesorhizobium sp. M0833 TaxID=2957009 RepID=UPI00333DE0D2